MRRAKSWHKHSLHAQCHDDKFMFFVDRVQCSLRTCAAGPKCACRVSEERMEEANGFLRKLINRDTNRMIRDILLALFLPAVAGDGT